MVGLPKGKAGQGYSERRGGLPLRVYQESPVSCFEVSCPFPVTATQLLVASQALIRILRLGTCLLGRSFWKIVLHIMDRLMHVSDPLPEEFSP